DPRRRRVPFPTYPFDHTTSHGPSLSAVAEVGSMPPEPPDADRPRLYAREWEPAPTAERAAIADRPLCLLTVGGEASLPLVEALPGQPDFRWIVLREPSTLPAVAADEYEVDFGDYEAGRAVARRILADHGSIGFMADLADVATSGLDGREGARVGVLQVMA